MLLLGDRFASPTCAYEVFRDKIDVFSQHGQRETHSPRAVTTRESILLGGQPFTGRVRLLCRFGVGRPRSSCKTVSDRIIPHAATGLRGGRGRRGGSGGRERERGRWLPTHPPPLSQNPKPVNGHVHTLSKNWTTNTSMNCNCGNSTVFSTVSTPLNSRA